MDIKDSLFQCSACKRAKYCSRECQKSSWATHKPLCSLLQEFKVHSNRINQTNGFQDPGTGVFKERVQTLESLLRVSGRLSSKKSELQWEQARNFIFHSNICSICFKTDYEFDHEDASKKPCWRNCDRCLYGWCCSDEHWDQYKYRHTPEICADYVASSSIERFLYKHVKNHDETFSHSSDVVLSEPMENFPRDWDEYHRIRSPDLHNHASTGRLPPEFLPAATKDLGQPVTCLYGTVL
jgi:hypothetical protein